MESVNKHPCLTSAPPPGITFGGCPEGAPPLRVRREARRAQRRLLRLRGRCGRAGRTPWRCGRRRPGHLGLARRRALRAEVRRRGGGRGGALPLANPIMGPGPRLESSVSCEGHGLLFRGQCGSSSGPRICYPKKSDTSNLQDFGYLPLSYSSLFLTSLNRENTSRGFGRRGAWPFGRQHLSFNAVPSHPMPLLAYF